MFYSFLSIVCFDLSFCSQHSVIYPQWLWVGRNGVSLHFSKPLHNAAAEDTAFDRADPATPARATGLHGQIKNPALITIGTGKWRQTGDCIQSHPILLLYSCTVSEMFIKDVCKCLSTVILVLNCIQRFNFTRTQSSCRVATLFQCITQAVAHGLKTLRSSGLQGSGRRGQVGKCSIVWAASPQPHWVGPSALYPHFSMRPLHHLTSVLRRLRPSQTDHVSLSLPNGRHSSGYSLSVWAFDCRILTCSRRIESLFCPYPSKPFIYVLPQVSLKCCYNICLNYLLLQLAPCTHHPLCLEKVAPLVPNKPYSYPSFPP